MAGYRMTPARRAALKKAQAASARKRRKGGGRKSLKKRYQKGQTGAGAIHRRRAAQWNSGRKRDKLKVIAKSGSYGGGITHAVSYARNKKRKRR